MAARAPLNEITLGAASVADDLAHVAIGDLARAVRTAAVPDHRIIGAHMVTAHVARWGLGADLHRETADADIGMKPVAITGTEIVDALRDLGYAKVEGNRFARPIHDVGAGVESARQEATIDILVPGYRGRLRQNHRVGDIVTTEVPGLAEAWKRPSIRVEVELGRLNAPPEKAGITIPDEVGALILKAEATQVRDKPTDVVDLWRLLEVASVAGVRAEDLGDHLQRVRALITHLFDEREGRGMRSLHDELDLDGPATDRRFTRITALIRRVLAD